MKFTYCLYTLLFFLTIQQAAAQKSDIELLMSDTIVKRILDRDFICDTFNLEDLNSQTSSFLYRISDTILDKNEAGWLVNEIDTCQYKSVPAAKYIVKKKRRRKMQAPADIPVYVVFKLDLPGDTKGYMFVHEKMAFLALGRPRFGHMYQVLYKKIEGKNAVKVLAGTIFYN